MAGYPEMKRGREGGGGEWVTARGERGRKKEGGGEGREKKGEVRERERENERIPTLSICCENLWLM